MVHTVLFFFNSGFHAEFKATLSVFSLFFGRHNDATTDDVDDRRRDAGGFFIFFIVVVRSIAKGARTTGERTGTRE